MVNIKSDEKGLTFTVGIKTNLYKELDKKLPRNLIDDLQSYKMIETMHQLKNSGQLRGRVSKDKEVSESWVCAKDTRVALCGYRFSYR